MVIMSISSKLNSKTTVISIKISENVFVEMSFSLKTYLKD